MTLFEHDAEPLTLPAQAREVFDVTGAGDTVIALLGAGVAAGLAPADAAALANLGAGIVVGKIGAATASRSELQRALHSQGSGGRGLVDLPELVALVAEAKARGERVVLTNGCFDILHAGHVSYLEEAKSCGDRLIVAVNDDDSVRRLKGASAGPINSLADRMAVLAGLASVDWVVPFCEDTPAELIAQGRARRAREGRRLPRRADRRRRYRAQERRRGARARLQAGPLDERADRRAASRRSLARRCRRASEAIYCCSQPSTCSTSVSDRLPAACFRRSTLIM